MKDDLVEVYGVPHLIECAAHDGYACSCGSSPRTRDGIAGIFVPLGPGYVVTSITAERDGKPAMLLDGREDVWFVGPSPEVRRYRKEARR